MKPIRMGDVWGGLSASSLVLPQAMAFGMTLWVPYTHAPAIAAMSGLLAAAFLCLISGIFRGTIGLVSAPTGPTLILLSGVMATLSSQGLMADQLVTATLLVVAMAGLFQMLIAALNLGHLIKFIPYPVVSGFMTGSAILMVMSQTHAVMGGSTDLTMQQGAWIPMATAIITMASMIFLPQWIKSVPGTMMGLVVGSLVFHALVFVQLPEIPAHWIVGALPSVADFRLGFQIEGFENLPWRWMIASGMALALLASLDTLLTSVVADVATGSRHHASKELLGQGGGHLLSSMVGGMAGAGTTGATLVAIQSGGRAWAGLTTGLCMLLMILCLGSVAEILPISVFAGIILHVAIFGMLDKDILYWLRTRQVRLDGLIALIVTVVTVFYDLMAAVALGVVLAVIEFIRAQVKSAIVQRRWTIRERSSLRRRPKREFHYLSEHAHDIVGYDLRGTLFFGTTDHLFDVMQDDLKSAKYIILDMRRVGQVDLTALHLIEHMHGMMRQRGGKLILASPPKSMGLVKWRGHKHKQWIPYHRDVHLSTFYDVDRALEHAEDRMLKEAFSELSGLRAIALNDTELMVGFREEEKLLLHPFFDRRHLKKKDYLFHQGDHGEDLYVLLSGSVEISLPYKQGKRLRLATFYPGMSVGEVAFLEPGERSADGRMVTDGEVAILRQAALTALCQQYSELGMHLLMHLGHDMSHHLRVANEELRRLAE